MSLLSERVSLTKLRGVAKSLVNYVVKKSPPAEELRLAWLDDADPFVASAGWALTADVVSQSAPSCWICPRS